MLILLSTVSSLHLWGGMILRLSSKMKSKTDKLTYSISFGLGIICENIPLTSRDIRLKELGYKELGYE